MGPLGSAYLHFEPPPPTQTPAYAERLRALPPLAAAIYHLSSQLADAQMSNAPDSSSYIPAWLSRRSMPP